MAVKAAGLIWLFLWVFIGVGSVDPLYKQYLWFNGPSPVGFGDGIRIWYDHFQLARQLNRTLIVAPFKFSNANLNKLKDLDTQDVIDRFGLTQDTSTHMMRLAGYLPHESQFVEASEWFDMDAMNPPDHPDTAVTNKYWRKISNYVDVAVIVPLPSPCGEHNTDFLDCTRKRVGQKVKQKGTQVLRWGQRMTFGTTFCLTDAVLGAHGGKGSKRLLEWLRVEFQDVPVLGLDQFCFERGEAFWQDTIRSDGEENFRKYLRWNANMTSKAQSFLRENGVGEKFVAVHWRRGDLSVDHAHGNLHQTPRWLVRAVEKTLNSLGWTTQVSGIDQKHLVVITDCPYAKELDELALQTEAVLGMKLVRYFTGDQAYDAGLDMCMAGMSSVFMTTYGGSFYAHFIEQDRELQGHPKWTNPDLLDPAKPVVEATPTTLGAKKDPELMQKLHQLHKQKKNKQAYTHDEL